MTFLAKIVKNLGKDKKLLRNRTHALLANFNSQKNPINFQ